MKIDFSVGKKSHYQKRDLELLHQYAQCSAALLMRPSTLDKISLTIHLSKKVSNGQGDNVNGACVWKDSNYRPKEFDIFLRTKGVTLYDIMMSLGHELVHMKQYATRELFQYFNTPHMFAFKGKKHDMRKVNYWTSPWEIEAFGRMHGLHHMFLETFGKKKLLNRLHRPVIRQED